MNLEYTLAVIFYKVPTQAFLATYAKNLGNTSGVDVRRIPLGDYGSSDEAGG